METSSGNVLYILNFQKKKADQTSCYWSDTSYAGYDLNTSLLKFCSLTH